jgi:FKBP-type peptidyl-prolyl cis-trans isomerase (trigger factor)
MKVEINKKGEIEVELICEAGKEEIEEEKNKIVKEIKKDVEIDGFRKGKVPEDIIEKKFSEKIREHIFRNIISKAYYETVRKENFIPVIQPEIYDVEFTEEKLSFKIGIELKPGVKIKKYKGITVKKVEVKEVKEEDVENTLKELEKRPEFASSIIDLEKRQMWKKRIREELEEREKNNARLEEEKQLWNALFNNSEFQVPQKLVEKKAREYTEYHLRRLNLQGKTKEEIENYAREIFKAVKPYAEEEVKKYFILDKIAEIENITVDEKEVDEKVEIFSRSIGKPFEEVKKELEETGEIENIRDEIKIDKAYKIIRDNINYIEKIVLPGKDTKK